MGTRRRVKKRRRWWIPREGILGGGLGSKVRVGAGWVWGGERLARGHGRVHILLGMSTAVPSVRGYYVV